MSKDSIRKTERLTKLEPGQYFSLAGKKYKKKKPVRRLFGSSTNAIDVETGTEVYLEDALVCLLILASDGTFDYDYVEEESEAGLRDTEDFTPQDDGGCNYDSTKSGCNYDSTYSGSTYDSCDSGGCGGSDCGGGDD